MELVTHTGQRQVDTAIDTPRAAPRDCSKSRHLLNRVRRAWRALVARRRWPCAIQAGGALLLLAACGSTPPLPPASPTASATLSGPAPAQVYVTFAPSITYESVLVGMTNLGLQLAWLCNGRTAGTRGWLPWEPVGQRDFFAQYHQVWLDPTPLAPMDWLSRLQARPGVTAVTTPSVFCPAIHLGTPPPTAIVFLNPDQAGAYTHVTFVQPLNSYDQALYAVSNLGLRLANPCYERAQNTPTVWQPMGEQSRFLSSQSLVVATTVNASNQWPNQLRVLAGVASVVAPYAASCS